MSHFSLRFFFYMLLLYILSGYIRRDFIDSILKSAWLYVFQLCIFFSGGFCFFLCYFCSTSNRFPWIWYVSEVFYDSNQLFYLLFFKLPLFPLKSFFIFYFLLYFQISWLSVHNNNMNNVNY